MNDLEPVEGEDVKVHGPLWDEPPYIEVTGLRKSFGSQKIHNGIDLKVNRGEILVLIGGSGEGKSVLLKQMIGLITPDEGVVQIDGVDIANLPERKLSETRSKVGILFQDGALFDSMTVAENVAFPLRQGGLKDRKEMADRVKDALTVVGLGEHLAKMPINLSGGMRKRVALARAIVGKPDAVLYDEPQSGLDPVVSGNIDRLIVNLRDRYGITSMVVTHDMKSVFRIADRVAFLKGGQIYFRGTPEELKNTGDSVIDDFLEGSGSDEF